MEKEELARKLNGKECGEELPDDLEVQAEESDLVVVFGCPDDLTEFRGAIFGETGRSVILLTENGLFDEDECADNCRYFRAAKEAAEKSGKKIEPRRSVNGYSWTYERTIPHAAFDIIENGKKYCRGIVFSISDLI